jgi:amidase
MNTVVMERPLRLVELSTRMRARHLSARQALEDVIARVEARNPAINAIVSTDWPAARKEADRLDQIAKRPGKLAALHGVAISVKDTLDVAGMSSTAGSLRLRGRVAARDAEAVLRLRSAGAIVIGRSNSPALAGDAQCDSELYGRTNNPWDLARTAGGSSGGAAAAVASGMVPLDIGSDAGGSLRIPAHCCGVVAHKPTEGLIPTRGHVPPLPGNPPFPEVLNVIGPIAASVDDLRLAMAVLMGQDAPRRIAGLRRRRYRIGWAADFGSISGRDVRSMIRRVADVLAEAGHHAVELRPDQGEVNRACRLHDDLVEVCNRGWYGEGRTPSFDELLGLFGERDRLADSFERHMAGVDAWLLPIMPSVAPLHCTKLSQVDVDGELRDYWDVFTANSKVFNVTGQPAVAIRIGTDESGLPIGAQLVGPRWSDNRLLEVASAVEHAASALAIDDARMTTSSGARAATVV